MAGQGPVRSVASSTFLTCSRQPFRPVSRRTPEPPHPPPTPLVWDQRLAIPHESSTSLVYGLTDQPTTRSRARPAGGSRGPRGREGDNLFFFFFFFAGGGRVSPAPHPPNHAPFLEAGGHCVPVNQACPPGEADHSCPRPGPQSRLASICQGSRSLSVSETRPLGRSPKSFENLSAGRGVWLFAHPLEPRVPLERNCSVRKHTWAKVGPRQQISSAGGSDF